MGFPHRTEFAKSMAARARSDLRVRPEAGYLPPDASVLSGKNEDRYSSSTHQRGAVTLRHWVSLHVTHIRGREKGTQSSLTGRHTVEGGRLPGVYG